MQCPGCDHEAPESEFGEQLRCPSCGAFYAKALALKQRRNEASELAKQKTAADTAAPVKAKVKVKVQESVSESSVTFSDWVDSNPSVRLFGVLVLGLLIGYFAGREHIKYELRSAMSESLAGLSAMFGGKSSASDSKPKLTKPSSLKALEKPSPITVRLIDKGFEEGKYGQSKTTIALSFLNGADADVRAFDGVLRFTDLLGNDISRVNIAVNESVGKGKELSWYGSVDYNQFMDSDQRLRNIENENLKVIFTVRKILYADGRIQEL